jgi:hypothetical protein
MAGSPHFQRTFRRAVALIALTLASFPAHAAEATAGSEAAGDVRADHDVNMTPAAKLALDEQRLAERYKHLEDVLLRMAELNAATDPRRAALLKKAVAQSKEQLITVRFDQLVELLGKDQLSKALENQTEVGRDLGALLELLLSENRAKRLENEKARLRDYLKRIDGIIKQQKDIQGRTSGGDQPARLTNEQAKVADKTQDLAEDVRRNEESHSKQDGGTEKGANRTTGKEKGGPEKKEGRQDGQPEQAKSEDNAKNTDSASPQPPQQETAENLTRQRLQAARQRMKEAETKLKESQRQAATEKQEEAILQLQLAKAKLEEILRQLREEEIGRTLAMLEARFRQMLRMQEEVYEGTLRLDKTPASERTHSFEIEAGRLGGKESEIVAEVDKALLVLRDDGSAAAFAEASAQIREDMVQVVERLARAKLDAVTQATEEDIMTALKEMIEAIKKARKDQDNKKSPPGQPSPSQMQEPPLVDVLAELKMVRALQMRVNTRTARYAKMIAGEQADNAELAAVLRQLAERQQRIERATRDLQREMSP